MITMFAVTVTPIFISAHIAKDIKSQWFVLPTTLTDVLYIIMVGLGCEKFSKWFDSKLK